MCVCVSLWPKKNRIEIFAARLRLATPRQARLTQTCADVLFIRLIQPNKRFSAFQNFHIKKGPMC